MRDSEPSSPEEPGRESQPERPARPQRPARWRARHSRGTLRTRRGVWAAAITLLVLAGVVASVLGARAVARSDAHASRLAFNLSSAEIASTLQLAIQHEEDLVISASAFVTGNPDATAADFDRWASSVKAMQRYPELQNIGLVMLVPAARVAAFEARMAADPLRPLGPDSTAPEQDFQILPPGNRPYYCFAVAGLARDAQAYLPAGLDYCALAPTLLASRETGVPSYAPFKAGRATTLGIETPVYRGGVTPPTVAARKRDFWGWLGELIVPEVIVGRALQGHPDVGVVFSYHSRSTQVQFGSRPRHLGGLASTVSLHNGWTVHSYGAPVNAGVLTHRNSLSLLVGGVLMSLLVGVLSAVLGTGRTRALSLVREKTRELSHQALHDALTGLPNRALVMDRAEQMLARCARREGMLAGALFIDVDGFKHVNDNLGHAAGDRLLRVVGERLQGAVREQDTVGRLGGDEFVVLVESRNEELAVDLLADRLTEALREPVDLGEGRKLFSLTASIGVAVGTYATPDDLLRDADLALYAAKAAGKDRYALFDASMYAGVEGRLELESDLARAIEDEQLFLLYQPIYDLARHEIVAVEALLRWQHPERGVVSPDSFIPLAEESGLISPIGRWVLEQACRQGASWAASGRRIGISVNVSAYQLGRTGFAEDVRRALHVSGLEAELLTLEITETTLMRDVAHARERLEEIKSLGVRVAIDDFGTGYASLSHLQLLPVDILKVDRSFVAALGADGQGRKLLEAIVGVGQSLSLTVVAEGIEQPSQLMTLETIGCQLAQGFLLGHPVPASEVGRAQAVVG